MSDDSHLARLLNPFGPTRPVADLVVDINLLYHAVEAVSYDDSHPEIFGQLPALWTSMLEQAVALLPGGPLTVVDYGCGTGFASSQALALLGEQRIKQLVCYDPSPEMLARCKERLKGWGGAPILYCTSEDEWDSGRVPRVDLLLTNSLLHHLPDPIAMARGIRARMGDNAVWIAGHEPSARFYGNPECIAVWKGFERERLRARYLSPRAYWGGILRKLGLGSDPASVAARQAFAQGWFRRKPDPVTIGLIVDLHVAHSPAEVQDGRGLDYEKMANQLDGCFSVHEMTSYSFLGPTPEVSAPLRWQQQCSDLARRYPRDGANFCVVWRAQGGPGANQ